MKHFTLFFIAALMAVTTAVAQQTKPAEAQLTKPAAVEKMKKADALEKARRGTAVYTPKKERKTEGGWIANALKARKLKAAGDGEVITEQPAGRLYDNMLLSYEGYLTGYFGMEYKVEESAVSKIVEGDDGCIYAYEMIGETMGSWVRMTRAEGDTVVIERQLVAKMEWNGEPDLYYITRYDTWIQEEQNQETGEMESVVYWEETEEPIKMLYKDGVLSAIDDYKLGPNDEVPPYAIGVANYDSGGYYGAYAIEWNTCIRPIAAPAMPPADAQVEKFQARFEMGGEQNAKFVNAIVNGSDLYLQTMNAIEGPSGEPGTGGWIKGSISGDKVTIAGGQYLGVYEGARHIFNHVGVAHWKIDEEYGYGYEEFELQDAIELNYDAATRTISSNGDDFLSIDGTPDNIYLFEYYKHFNMAPWAEVPAVPAQPQFQGYYPSSEWSSNSSFYFSIPETDADGNMIDLDKLTFTCFVDNEPYTFSAANGFQLEADMTEVPYHTTINYRDEFLYWVSSSFIYLPFDPTVNIGLQTTYYGGGQANKSDIMWYDIATGEVTYQPYDNSPATETVDEHGVITAPAKGEHCFYERSGQGLYEEDGYLMWDDQDGVVEMVECADGTVYIKDPISKRQFGTWVKGTKEGNTITVPTKQPVTYSDEYQTTVSLRWVQGSENGDITADDSYADAFTFTVDGDVITLQGTDSFSDYGHHIGLFWDDNLEFAGYADALTVWTKTVIITQVDELPYSNGFDTAAERMSFSVVNNSEDSFMWRYYDGSYYVMSLTDHPADDWLISLPIKLEAGKNYHLSLDAWGSRQPNLVVTMGKEATPAALTQEVFNEPCESTAPITFHNERITVSETGYYYFGIRNVSDQDYSSLYVDNFFIEEGPHDKAPAAITDLAVSQEGVALQVNAAFTAPAKTFDGSELTEITKIELLRDGNVVSVLNDVPVGGPAFMTDNASLTLGKHTYEVVAYNSYGRGQKAAPVSIFVIEPLEIPYTADFSDAETFGMFSVIDNNSDNVTWAWDADNMTARYNWAYVNGDDYLVSMPINAQTGHNYKVTLKARSEAWGAERLEVLAGRAGTPAGLTTTVIEPTELQSGDFVTIEGNFTAQEDGLCFIAVHAISDMYNNSIYLSELTIEPGADPLAPAAPADLAVAPAAMGEKKAIVSFTAPSLTVNGSELTEITKAEVLCDGSVAGTKESITPGAGVEITAEVPVSGNHVFEVVAHNAYGPGIKSGKVTAWVGQDVPAGLQGLEVVDNGSNVEFKWNPVGTEGANGGYVNPAEVEYQLWDYEWDGFSWFSPIEQLASTTGTDHFTYNYNTDEGEQQLMVWGIKPVNEAGEGQFMAAAIVVGAPYQLPFVENLKDGALAYRWDSDQLVGAYLTDDASDGDGHAMRMARLEEPGTGTITTGKIDLNSCINQPMLTFDAKSETIHEISLYGCSEYGALQPLGTYPVTTEYSTIEVPVGAVAGGRFSRIVFSVDFQVPTWAGWFEVESWGDTMYLDNICITDTDGITELSELKGKDRFDVYTIDGRLVRRQAADLKGLKGLYLVNGQKMVIK